MGESSAFSSVSKKKSTPDASGGPGLGNSAGNQLSRNDYESKLSTTTTAATPDAFAGPGHGASAENQPLKNDDNTELSTPATEIATKSTLDTCTDPGATAKQPLDNAAAPPKAMPNHAPPAPEVAVIFRKGHPPHLDLISVGGKLTVRAVTVEAFSLGVWPGDRLLSLNGKFFISVADMSPSEAREILLSECDRSNVEARFRRFLPTPMAMRMVPTGPPFWGTPGRFPGRSPPPGTHRYSLPPPHLYGRGGWGERFGSPIPSAFPCCPSRR